MERRETRKKARRAMVRKRTIRTPKHDRRPHLLRQRIKRQRGDDRARLARGGGHPVCEGAEARGEDFCWVALDVDGVVKSMLSFDNTEEMAHVCSSVSCDGKERKKGRWHVKDEEERS